MNAGSLFFIVAIFAALWFLMIRPQRQRQRQQQLLLDSIRPGDEVLTVGGLYGIVQELEEDGNLVVEIAEGIHVRIARRAVAGVEKPDEEGDEGEDELEAAGGEEAAAAADEAAEQEAVEETAPASDEGEVVVGEESVNVEPGDTQPGEQPR